MKRVLNFMRRHTVSILMVVVTAGFIIGFTNIDPVYKPYLFFTLPLAFMIRGIYWDEKYRRQAVRLYEESSNKELGERVTKLESVVVTFG